MRIFLLILLMSPLFGVLPSPRLDILCGPDRFSLGPEVYYVERDRQILFDLKGKLPSELHQKGWMYGERFSYDRVRFNALYYGADQYYAVGKVQGCCSFGMCPQVNLTDAEIEGRLGYTLGFSSPYSFYFTPLVGFGNFTGKEVVIRYARNRRLFILPSHQDFVDPHMAARLKITNRPRLYFFSAGFLSGFFFNECSSAGVNFKVKIPTSARNKLEFCFSKRQNDIYYYDDDDNWEGCGCKEDCFRSTSLCQKMGKLVMYQVDVPLTFYGYYIREEAFELSLIPFWRNRLYGYRQNYPFDFPKTTYNMVGARFLVTYVF